MSVQADGFGDSSGSPPPEVPPPEIRLRDALRPSGPARFELRTEHRPDVVVVQVEGELDVLTVPKLAGRLDRVIRSGATDVVLDLRKVRFMDSAGLQLLLNARRRLVKASRTLSVVCGEGPVSRLIELARLNEALRVTSSYE